MESAPTMRRKIFARGVAVRTTIFLLFDLFFVIFYDDFTQKLAA